MPHTCLGIWCTWNERALGVVRSTTMPIVVSLGSSGIVAHPPLGGGGGGGGGGQIYIKAPPPTTLMHVYTCTCPSIAANHVNHKVYKLSRSFSHATVEKWHAC